LVVEVDAEADGEERDDDADQRAARARARVRGSRSPERGDLLLGRLRCCSRDNVVPGEQRCHHDHRTRLEGPDEELFQLLARLV